jgi:LuxR family maltose regulon positive regulatory protein
MTTNLSDVRALADRDEPAQLLEPLTAREMEVLAHLSELLSTEEIAATMFVSVNTVRTHVRGILRKLGVSRRTDAVRRGWALGLVER